MRILLITQEQNGWERLGIACLSTVLINAGHDVKIVVLAATNQKQLEQDIMYFKPTIVGFTAMTAEYHELLEVNNTLKKRFSFFTVFGGPHPTFIPSMVHDEGIDAICIGEADYTFLEFCNRMEKGENYWETPCFHVHHEGKLWENPVENLIENLDDLPILDRKLLYEADPSSAILSSKAFASSRGCPYTCTYCFNKPYNDLYDGLGKKLRFHSPEYVVKSIESVKENYPLNMVNFSDDVFMTKPRGWISEFSELYKKRINLPFSILVFPSVVKEEQIAQLKDAGLRYAWIGVETGDEDSAKNLLDRNVSNEKILNGAKLFRDHGVHLVTLNLSGLPHADPFMIDLKTIDLNIQIKPTLASFGLLYPYPGTSIDKISRKQGFLKGTPPQLSSNKRSSVFNFSSPLEKRKVENLQKIAGIIVNFPFLRPYAETLSRLPLGGFYRFLYYIWMGYCQKFKLSPAESLIKELPIYIKMFWRLFAKT
jgi:anaerobic magnesium-protoporphyrin IX monomethyl ester cyclase